MLHQGQLIDIRYHIIDYPIKELRLPISAKLLQRSSDRLSNLIWGEAWRQKLRFIHRFGQTVKCVAIAQKIRAHCDDYENWHSFLLRHIEEKINKCSGFVAFCTTLTPASIAKQLLKLIDEYEDRSRILSSTAKH